MILTIPSSLHKSGLVLASGAKETREARAGAGTVVTDTTTGAISASFVSVAIKRVGTGGAFLLIASGTAVTSITQAANVLHGIPRGRVHATNLACQMLLRPAGTSIVTVVGADGTLASNTVITSKTLASPTLSVTDTLVGALSPGVQVVLVDHITDPSKILGAGSQRAIRSHPLSLTVQTQIAVAVVVDFASTVT